MTVQGKLNGKITMQGGSLLVADGASVQAATQVSRITIHGTLAGDVTAAERVELTATAQVSGTIVAPAVVIQEGAVFNGMLEINRGASKRAAA